MLRAVSVGGLRADRDSLQGNRGSQSRKISIGGLEMLRQLCQGPNCCGQTLGGKNMVPNSMMSVLSH